MKHTLVKPDGTLGSSRDFEEGAAQQLPAIKGRWLPDIPLTFDPITHTVQPVNPQPANATSITYELVARDPAVVARDQRIINETAERQTVKKIPAVKQFRRLNSKSDVRAWVNSASNLNQLKDIVETLAFAVWVQAQRDDINDE